MREDTHSQKPTHTVEDYLMRMLVMERDHGAIVSARLAELLEVAPPTVAMTLRRMERDGYVVGRGRKTLHLTPLGREFGYSVTRRHMLIEWLLIKILKVPLRQVHDEAHGLEHAISETLEERMVEILGDPKVCPHGNPLPGFEDVVADWKPVIDMKTGQSGTIRRIHENAEDDHELLAYLIENELLPGQQLTLVNFLPFNQTCNVMVNGKEHTLGLRTASQIFVEQD